MLTAEQIQLAEETARELPGLTDSEPVRLPATDTGRAPAPEHNHEDVAILLLTQMIERNLDHARRMLALGDLTSVRHLLQSAISQVDQIAAYQPKIQNRTTIEI